MMQQLRAGSILAIRRAAQLAGLLVNVLRGLVLWPFLVLGLLVYPHVFQKKFYACRDGASWLRRHFPWLHFVSYGAWTLEDPHPRFSQVAMLRDFPRLMLYPPVLNHVLNPNAEIDFPLPHSAEPAPVAPSLPQNSASNHEDSAASIHEDSATISHADTGEEPFWPVFRLDARAFARPVSSLTPTPQVERSIRQNLIGNPDYSAEGDAVIRLLARFPERVDHLIIVPWLGIKGGSERVTERYLSFLRARYRDDRICIFAPDVIHNHSEGAEDRYGVRIVAINDELPQADQGARIRIFDRVMVNLQPATMHNINSLTGWLAMQKFGANYAAHTKTFLNLYSDIRLEDAPIGYYHNFLPYMLDNFEGALCDNATIICKAVADFSLTRQQAAKFHFVPTPILGLNGGDPRRDLRRFKPSGTRRSLWMSRIAPEKRLDIVDAIARRMPERRISVYGATLAVGYATDMSWRERPNIDYEGEFGRLGDLPMDEFDSYLFTSNGEGMPLAVLEATMYGLPVVAPDVGGIRELIDEETGWIVSGPDAVNEYVAALRQIERDPEEARRRVERAQARLVERHSLANFMRVLEGIPGYMQVRD